MNKEFQSYFSDIVKSSIINITRVSGGDISKAYCIDTTKNKFFLKINSASNAQAMFEKEAYGLDIIQKSDSVQTPKVISYGSFENNSFLILEHIEPKSAAAKDFQKLGEQLAKMHTSTLDAFGLEYDNFIGSLKQSNSFRNNWLDFYTEERLTPQLSLSKNKGLLSEKECPSLKTMKDKLSIFFEDIKPSLLHGDLWGGNYLIANNGIPYLIDPTVYYGHSEVDIAMTKLFGGFNNAFYETYHALIPKDKYTDSRIEIYQLYYLLVHLNMFGSSYYGSVKRILTKYF